MDELYAGLLNDLQKAFDQTKDLNDELVGAHLLNARVETLQAIKRNGYKAVFDPYGEPSWGGMWHVERVR